MARDVTGNPADDSPLDAALCLSSYRQSNKSDERGENNESFHCQIHVSTKLKSLSGIWFQLRRELARMLCSRYGGVIKEIGFANHS